MSNVRNMLNDKGSKNREKSKSISWSKYLTSATKIGFNAFLDIGRWSYMNARVIGWFIVTTGIVTALPLIFEIKREGVLEEFERAQVNSELSQGKTPIEMANAGFTAALEPKVLS